MIDIDLWGDSSIYIDDGRCVQNFHYDIRPDSIRVFARNKTIEIDVEFLNHNISAVFEGDTLCVGDNCYAVITITRHGTRYLFPDELRGCDKRIDSNALEAWMAEDIDLLQDAEEADE